MTWWHWLLVSNTAIAVVEYMYRKGSYDSFIVSLPYIAIPVLLGQVGLFYGFRHAPSLVIAGVTFSIINSLLRVGNTLLLGERLGMYQVIALLLMIAASFVARMK